MVMAMGIETAQTPCITTFIFTYGTLKRGFSNHTLIQDLMRTGDAVFKGTYTTVDKFPLVCGPYKVPFLLNFPGSGLRVTGELYGVSACGLARMDELEGTTRGHYQRLPIRVVAAAAEDEKENEENSVEIECVEAYFADKSYDKELWRRNGNKGFGIYSEKEAKGYVRRKDRPQNLSFLDQIRIFIASSSE
ncbi:putative gamma-glutamylcyclotransferase At3g02910 [Mangifera indica]|uniref:putative gamma-glutamylcyclotransferase At3g02910 n=1 Tax=Mangifera indica TaxID=29780 RepID=UPI001CFB8EBE|nr:putative gamma-glutamylcyclotransferase At3g02910 [Mangifera indica]